MARSSSSVSGQRPLRVGEEIRHVLADVLQRGDFRDEKVDSLGVVTISEVRVSPDLKNATAFVMPLGGKDREEIMQALIRLAPQLRTQVARRMKLRYSPRIHFRLDTSYDEAHRIEELLKSPRVRADVEKDPEE